MTSARQQLSFKNHAGEKPETTEKQTNIHWRGTEDTKQIDIGEAQKTHPRFAQRQKKDMGHTRNKNTCATTKLSQRY